MDVHFSSFEFQGIACELMLYGCFWIQADHLEAVRETMISQGMNTSHITSLLNDIYLKMGTSYWTIMCCIQPFGLRLGVSRDKTQLIVDEDLD